MAARVIEKNPIFSAKWLKLTAVKYADETGRERIWETLERTTHGTDREVDAVELVPIIKKKGETPQLIVIKQFRPPVGKYMIELPAGLVDSKESVVDAALRELKEETGYTGQVVDESIELLLGMAISSTTIKIVTVEINGDLPENDKPKQHLEEGEYAEVIVIPVDKIQQQCEEWKKQGYGVDGKIWFLGYASKFMNFSKSSL